jgi:hypothetical protein
MFMNARRIFWAFVATMMIAAGASGQASDPNAKQLSGAWKVIVTSGEGGPPPFPSLFTFARDGGVVQTDAGPPAPDQPISTFSTGLGEWRRTGKRQFIITYTQFQFDQGQNLIGTFRGRISATLNSELSELTGELTVEFFDTDDNLIFTGDGTVRGSRLPVLGAN